MNRQGLLDEAMHLDRLQQLDLAEHFEEVTRDAAASSPIVTDLVRRSTPVAGPSGGGQGTGNSNPDRGLFDDFPKGVVL